VGCDLCDGWGDSWQLLLFRDQSPVTTLSASCFDVLWYRKLCKDIKNYVQKCVDSGKEINLPFAVKTGTISKGLKYSLATGNWGQQGTQGIRAGVSQVGPSGGGDLALQMSHVSSSVLPFKLAVELAVGSSLVVAGSCHTSVCFVCQGPCRWRCRLNIT